MRKENDLWKRRNITDESRVKEFIDLYQSMGFEVKVENFIPSDSELECNECMLEEPDKFKVILTRRSKINSDELSEDLY